MATCSPSELVEAGKCFLPITAQQREAIMLALLCRLIKTNNPMATCDPTELMADAKCFMCLTEPQMMAVQTQLLCELLQGGGVGGTCIICLEGESEPTEDGPCECSIAYNMIGQFWFWNSITAKWFPISL